MMLTSVSMSIEIPIKLAVLSARNDLELKECVL